MEAKPPDFPRLVWRREGWLPDTKSKCSSGAGELDSGFGWHMQVAAKVLEVSVTHMPASAIY